jgi:hypothetical protein
MKCPICDQKLISGYSTSKYCEAHYQRYSFDDIEFENFHYGNFCIQLSFLNKKLVQYYFYFKSYQIVIPADQLSFDPKNPENVINKIKTVMVFS